MTKKIPYTDEMKAHVKAESDRTGIKGTKLVELFRDTKPETIKRRNVHDKIVGASAKIREDDYQWILESYKKAPELLEIDEDVVSKVRKIVEESGQSAYRIGINLSVKYNEKGLNQNALHQILSPSGRQKKNVPII